MFYIFLTKDNYNSEFTTNGKLGRVVRIWRTRNICVWGSGKILFGRVPEVSLAYAFPILRACLGEFMFG